MSQAFLTLAIDEGEW